MPVVDVEEVWRYRVPTEDLQRRAAEEAKPPDVVVVAVDLAPVEGGGMVDQPQPVPMGFRLEDAYRGRAFG